MCYTPGTNMLPAGSVAMTHHTCVYFIILAFGEKKRLEPTSGTSSPPTETTREANSNENVEAGYMAA